MTVLVTNASGAKGLIVTRSLGKKKIEVITADSERLSAAFFSKYSKNHFLYPSPLNSSTAFINKIKKYVETKKIDVLMPINSTETLLISKYKDKFEPYTEVPFADYSKMIRLHDKEELAKIATELSLPIPKTYFVEDATDIRKIAKIIEYPAVIKLKDATSSVGIQYVYSEDEFLSRYKQVILKYALTPHDYPLVQEYVPGGGYGVSALFNQGDIRAIFTHKRLREYPISGGPSTFRESIRHPEMEKIATKILEHVDWHGVAMVEFKLDERTNKPVLIEINPRFWGSINQAIASGVDFPYLLYKMAIDGDVQPVLNYKVGVRTRFLMDDFLALFSQLKRSGGRVRTIKDFLGDGYKHDDVMSFGDALPVGFFVYTNVKKILKQKVSHNKFYNNFISFKNNIGGGS